MNQGIKDNIIFGSALFMLFFWCCADHGRVCYRPRWAGA